MKKYSSWIIVGVLVAAIIAAMVWYSSGPGEYDQFATCIKNSGATFWGAWWCPHCKDQKAEFGKSVEFLPYHECSTADGSGQLPDCTAAGITSYPTWDFKSLTNPATTTRENGVLTLEQLATFTGCTLKKDTTN